MWETVRKTKNCLFLPSMMAERTMVMTGQVKMMQRASGTGMKLTLARQVMEEMAPTRPENIRYNLVFSN